MPLFFPTERPNLFCFVEGCSTRKINCEMVSNLFHSHGLECHFIIRQVIFTFHRSGCQNQPFLRHSIKPNASRSGLKDNLHDFFTPSNWLLSSSDVNPLDYFALAGFETFLTKIRDEIPQRLKLDTFMSFEHRFQAVVKERGERYELS
jgi:hypothetical protein